MLTFIFQEMAFFFFFLISSTEYINLFQAHPMRPASNQDLKSLGLRTALSQKSFYAKLFTSYPNCFQRHEIQTLYCFPGILTEA